MKQILNSQLETLTFEENDYPVLSGYGEVVVMNTIMTDNDPRTAYIQIGDHFFKPCQLEEFLSSAQEFVTNNSNQ